MVFISILQVGLKKDSWDVCSLTGLKKDANRDALALNERVRECRWSQAIWEHRLREPGGYVLRQGGSQRCDQDFCPSQCTFCEAIADSRPIHSTPHEAGLLESLEVLRDCRLRKREIVDEIATKTFSLPSEDTENLHAGRMSESFCERSELFIGFVAFDRP